MPVAPNQLLGSSYSVNPGVSPLTTYSPADTNAAVSQIYAKAFQDASAPYLLNKDYNPGTGTEMSASNMQLAVPQQASILANANLQAANQQTGDAFNNANSLLGGEQLEANTALGLAGLAGTQQQQLFGQRLTQGQYFNQLLGDVGGNGNGYLGTLLGDV